MKTDLSQSSIGKIYNMIVLDTYYLENQMQTKIVIRYKNVSNIETHT